MKKNLVKVKDFIHLQEIRKKVNDAFAAGKAEDAAAAIRALLDEMETMEVEVDEEELKSRVLEILEGAEPSAKTNEAIANAIAKRMVAIQNTAANKELPAKVKNQICAAYFRANGKADGEKAVNDVLVKNEISGLTFNDVIDYTVVENWGDWSPLFKRLHKTMYSKFFYNDDTLKSEKDILAKEWTKTSTYDKVMQQIATEGKRIETKYIYKMQEIANEDLDNIEESNESSNFMKFINDELDAQIVSTIVMSMLVGDNTNEQGNRLTTFETIGTKTESDPFTYVANPATAGTVEIEDLRAIVDEIKNPQMKEVVLLANRKVISHVAEFIYGDGGSTSYRSNEDLAKQIGVAEVIDCDLLDDPASESGSVYAVALIPDGYWYKEKKAIAVSYPKWERNTLRILKERNIGGAIHDLHSTAVLRKAEEE